MSDRQYRNQFLFSLGQLCEAVDLRLLQYRDVDLKHFVTVYFYHLPKSKKQALKGSEGLKSLINRINSIYRNYDAVKTI